VNTEIYTNFQQTSLLPERRRIYPANDCVDDARQYVITPNQGNSGFLKRFFLIPEHHMHQT